MKKPLCLLLSIFLLSCSSKAPLPNLDTEEWKYIDLRIIDTSDVVDPNLDLIAFYIRDQGKSIEFRLDFLTLDPTAPTGILIAFDHGYSASCPIWDDKPLPASWNQLLIINPDGRVFLMDTKSKTVNTLRVSIIRDTTLDALVIKINKNVLIGYSIKTKIFINSYDSNLMPYDEMGPALLNGSPPKPIELVVAFWNTIQSKTSSQVLRAWDGAHTGPYSTRHGLKALLEAVGNTDVPVHLIDLDNRQNNSALDFLNVLAWINRLEGDGLLHLTQIDKSILNAPPYEIIPIESSTPTIEILPTVETRKRIVDARQDKIIVLGGDFSKSILGNYNYAFQLLSYIKNHPWLKTKTLSQSYAKQPTTILTEDEIIESINLRLRTLPNNQIKIVIQQFITSYHEEENSQEKELRSRYLGQIGHLLAILEWSNSPRVITECEKDLDWDQRSECLLTTETTASIIETDGGYISFAFAIHSSQIHQIIGPSYQLMVGLSDSGTWDFSQGLGADPNMIPGAFASSLHRWLNYSPLILTPGTILLENNELGITKEFSISEYGLIFTFRGIDPDQFFLPVLLDPWIMDVRGWGNMFVSEYHSGEWKWGIENQITMSLQSSEQMDIETFIDSRDYLGMPEQPSFAYPEGHFLPFPLAIAKINADGEGIIQLTISY